MAETWSVRLEEQEKERLTQLIEQSGLSSKDFLTSMLSSYELTKAKNTIPLLSEDIDELQRITTRINSIYSNVGERIQTLLNTKDEEYKKLLEDKQSVISLMNEKNLELSTLKDENKREILILKSNVEELQKQLLNEQKISETNQHLAEEYKNKVNLIESEIEEHKAIREDNKILQKSLNDITLKNEKNEMELSNLRNELNEIKQKHDDELNNLKDSLSLKYDKEILKLKEDYQTKLQTAQEQYNNKVQELLEKLEQQQK